MVPKYPQWWEESKQKSDIEFVPVAPGSAEFTHVESLFKQTLSYKISRIHRYQHPIAWAEYCERKAILEAKNGGIALSLLLVPSSRVSVATFFWFFFF